MRILGSLQMGPAKGRKLQKIQGFSMGFGLIPIRLMLKLLKKPFVFCNYRPLAGPIGKEPKIRIELNLINYTLTYI
jgi:hypothetical protein